MTEHQNDVDRVAELIGKGKVALVTTVGPEGQLLSRPLAMLNRDFDGDLYFFTADPSGKTEQVRDNDQVNVAIEADGGYLSVAGTATISRDSNLIDELWNAGAQAWFEQGRDDPAVALLKVHADSAEFWTIDSPKVVTLVKYAKAVVTGSRPDVGESKAVDL